MIFPLRGTSREPRSPGGAGTFPLPVQPPPFSIVDYVGMDK
jgi:hypothetical protein